MSPIRTLILATLLVAPAAQASPFTNFADDENACRQTGTQAIAGAAGPTAAGRYDRAYNQCMADHIRFRQRNAFLTPPPGAPGGGPNGGFPDAFYSIPYATPGYGYDGFSPP